MVIGQQAFGPQLEFFPASQSKKGKHELVPVPLSVMFAESATTEDGKLVGVKHLEGALDMESSVDDINKLFALLSLEIESSPIR